MKKILVTLAALAAFISYFSAASAYSQETPGKDTVYVIEIKQNIDNSSMRKLSLGLEDAQNKGVDYIILHIDTYGGAVDAADSMRKAILHAPVPVVAFVDLQAASAGATRYT